MRVHHLWKPKTNALCRDQRSVVDVKVAQELYQDTFQCGSVHCQRRAKKTHKTNSFHASLDTATGIKFFASSGSSLTEAKATNFHVHVLHTVFHYTFF